MFMVKRNMMCNSLKSETIWNNLLAVGIIDCEHVHDKEKHDVKQSQG